MTYSERRKQALGDNGSNFSERRKQFLQTGDEGGNVTPSITAEEPKRPTFLQKVGNTIKNVITRGPLGLIEDAANSVDTKIAKADNIVSRNIGAGLGDVSSATLNSIGGYDSQSGPALQVKESSAKAQSQGDNTIPGQLIRTIPRAVGAIGSAYLGGGLGVGKALPFLYSLGQTYGGAYGQARDAGVDKNTARTAALIQAVPQAGIEMLGGIEGVPAGVVKNGLLKTIGKAALEEAGEELMQYPFEGLAKRITYAKNTPVFSTKENAIINPKEMATNALVGGLAGGIMGGAGKVINDVSAGKPLIKADTSSIDEPVQMGTFNPKPRQTDFYTDQFGNTATGINQSKIAPKTLQMLPAPQENAATFQTPQKFSPNRITPANLSALQRHGLNPEPVKLSDKLNPLSKLDIKKPIEPVLKPQQPTVDNEIMERRIAARQEAATTTEQTAETRHESPILQQRRKAEQLRREYEQIRETSKLTPDELTIAENIRKGKLSQVPQGMNAQIINDVANAGRVYDEAEGQVKAFNENRKQELRDSSNSLIEESDNAKDKAGWQYARETMERNNVDTFGQETGSKINDTVFRPVHDNEARRTRFINKYVDMAKKLNLSKAESEAVQMLGEGKIAETDLPADMDKTKVKNAINEFRKIYDGLITLANDVLVKNGYAPSEYRKDYFPHFEDPQDPFVKAMGQLGFKVDNMTLPTDIAGITHQFRPGKKWFGNFLRREGNTTTYDALEGFERYLYGISDVIYHTYDIQRLRAFETAIRTKYAPDNIKNRIAEIEQSGLSQEEQQAAIDELFNIDKGHLGSYVTNLRDYTDTLAGKKSQGDRRWEHMLRRKVYNFFDNVNMQVTRNMVGWNVGSWLTNFIPIAQGGAGISTNNLIKAAKDTVMNYHTDDGFINKSTFLTNRKGTERLVRSGWQKAADAGMKPMQLIDEFASQIITRGKYLDEIQRGTSPIEAMKKADSYAAGAIADRSKGALPTAFNMKNPLTKLLTMFQVEVNNQFSFLFKDLPRESKELGAKWLASTLLKFMVGSFLYNELYEKLTGRRPTIDPIGTVKKAIESESPLESLGTDVMEQTPFVGGILPSALGLSQGGGRLPIGAALPDFQQIGGAVKDIKENGWSLGRAGDLASGILKNPVTYLLSPVGGGGQLKKSIEGIGAFSKGASLTDKGQMRYPIEKTPLNALRTGLFGQYSTPEARDYFDTGKKALSDKQTTSVMNSDDPQAQFAQIHRQREINSLSEQIKQIAKDSTMTRTEKDRKISELRNKILDLRAAQ